MNNAILFFYNINVQEIKKICDRYYFLYLNNYYVISPYKRDISDVDSIYYLNSSMLEAGINGYKIVLTLKHDFLFVYEDVYYVLMIIPNIKNRLITYDDVMNFYFPVLDNKYKKLDKSDWGYNWAGKIDFIYYQFAQVKNRFPIIDNSIDYFIGIWENGISYYNNNRIFNVEKCVCHKRIDVNMDLLDFLNPLNFVIDYKERDLGDYLKSFVINSKYTFEQVEKILKRYSRNSVILLISRLLFPSYYFDIYEDIVLEEKNEEEIIPVIEKINNINLFLKYLFDYYSNFNIPYIEWIKKID